MKKIFIKPETFVYNVQSKMTILAESLTGGGNGQDGDIAQTRVDWDIWEEDVEK